MQFYQNPRFRDKILTISSLKFHVIHTKSILKVVSIPFWLDPFFLFFSSSSSSSSSILGLHSLFLSLQMRLIWSLKSRFLLGLVWPSKTHFWVLIIITILSPNYWPFVFQFIFIVFWPLSSRNYTTIPIISSLAPFWTNYKIVLKFYNFPGLSFPGFAFIS